MKEKEDIVKESGKEQNQKESSSSAGELLSARLASLEHLRGFSGSRHKRKRLGRGRSSGHGGTSTKGHKGQRARSGFGLLRGFEGGQMPLVRLLPKFGFTNGRFKKKYDIINLSVLNRFDSEVDPSVLYSAGLVKKKAFVKILAQGELNKPLIVRAHHFSKKAIELIEQAGGKTEKLVSVVDNSDVAISSSSTRSKESEASAQSSDIETSSTASSKESEASAQSSDIETTSSTSSKEPEASAQGSDIDKTSKGNTNQ